MFYIVPNDLLDMIDAAIDGALSGRPLDAREREDIRTQLIQYYNLHGSIPEFTLTSLTAITE